MFDRETVIESIIDNDFESLFQPDNAYYDYSFFESILREGFKGYDNMTDEELMKECEERDISYLVGGNDDE